MSIRRIIFCIVFIVCASQVCFSGNDNYPLGARSVGMATSSVALSDVWSAVNNQAALAYIEQPAVALYYENRLNVRELALQSGAFVVPVGGTVIGANYRYFGYSKYNEFKFGLAIGKRLGERFAAGVQMNYFQTYFAGDYNSINALCGEIGVMYEPVEKLKIGAHLFNVTQTRQKLTLNGRLPTIMRLGLGYAANEKATITVETEKDLRMNAVIKAGLEYNPIGDLFLRCGMSNGNLHQYTFGVGYGWKYFTVDIAFSHHKFLGFSPHIALIANLNNSR